MEAPEKIYLQVCGDCPQTDCKDCKFEDLEDNVTWCVDRIFPKDVEYTRTDAFIEKATEFILKYASNSNPYGISNKARDILIKEFKKAMKQ
jgi:hypothetical protein